MDTFLLKNSSRADINNNNNVKVDIVQLAEQLYVAH